MKKYLAAGFLSTIVLMLGITPVNAHCPLCTAATGVGIAIAESYGVDGVIIGLWVGAFIISTALWFDRILKKKYSIPFQSAIISVLSLVLTVVPFYFAGMFTNPITIMGIDRLLFGIILGSAIAFSGTELSIWIKNIRGKVLFPYQTIVLVTGALTVTSFIFQYIIRNTGLLG